MPALTIIQLGFLVGALPTICMMIASYILSKMEENERLNAFMSNFAGGIIISAVAAELFPLITRAPRDASMVGCTIGFLVGMTLVLFMDDFVEFVVNICEKFSGDDESSSEHSKNGSTVCDGDHGYIGDSGGDFDAEGNASTEKKVNMTYPDGYTFEDRDVEDNSSAIPSRSSSNEASIMRPPSPSPSPSPSQGGVTAGYSLLVPSTTGKATESPGTMERKKIIVVQKNVAKDDDFDEEGVNVAVNALREEGHKSHIQEHMNEICDMIRLMGEDCKKIINMDTASAASQRKAEEIAEAIDENIHLLQYKVDHSRRLLQGNESNEGGGVVRSWLTEEKKKAMTLRLGNLNAISDHIIEHIQEDVVDKALIKELYDHMGEMETQISKFHSSVCDIGNRWVRKGRSARSLPVVEEGDSIPVNLVIPVVIDCFVDGFLIGIAVSLAPKAGFVLCAANCLEMSILGMAYSGAVSKCTKSSELKRLLALYVPPLIMWLAAGLGAAVGAASYKTPSIFVAFVAFGIVNLIFLACVELIPEAKEINEKEENGKWYILAPVFFGLWLIILLDGAF